MRIDEERMTNSCGETNQEGKNGSDGSYTQDAVQEYNSTLPSPLVPLPKEIPERLKMIVAKMHRYQHGTWQWNFFRHNYGTPSKATPAECGGVGEGNCQNYGVKI
jgi:hypothetical protein